MADYYFNQTPAEMDRLAMQATVLALTTRRMIVESGFRPGMRVRDVGCGAGDVAMLTAELGGPETQIVAIDPSASAFDYARSRASARSLNAIAFVTSSLQDYAPSGDFDMVIGRYVALHQPDPVAFVRQAARHLRPGGLIGFHEIDLRKSYKSWPKSDRFNAIAAFVMDLTSAAIPRPETAGHLAQIFYKAGLPAATLFCESPAGTENSPIVRWLALIYAMVHALSGEDSEPIDVEGLISALRHDLGRKHSQILSPDQVCAWAEIPG